MMAQLLWIVAVYALAALTVQLVRRMRETGAGRRSSGLVRYILITRNHEQVVEGIVRLQAWDALRAGRPGMFVIVDDGSEDRTADIISRLRGDGYPVEISREAASGQGVVYDLRRYAPHEVLPFLQRNESRGFLSGRN